MIKLFFCDVETTGTDPKQHGIHQISAIIEYVDCYGGETVETINIKMRPADGLLIDDNALEVSGVTREDLAGYQSESDAFGEIQRKLKRHVSLFDNQDKLHFVGYNVMFDNVFVRELFSRNGDEFFGSIFWSNPIDVMTMAGVSLLDKRDDMSNFKLVVVASKMGMLIDEDDAHDAMWDIQVTRDMFWLIYRPVFNLPPIKGAEYVRSASINTTPPPPTKEEVAKKLLGKTEMSGVTASSGGVGGSNHSSTNQEKPVVLIDSFEFVITFGKHKGSDITKILDENPSYIVWLHDEKIRGYHFSQDIIDVARKINELKQAEYQRNKTYSGTQTPYDGN